MKKIVSTDKAPPAAGPYSQAVIVNGFVYLAGQVGLDPVTRQFAGSTIQEQTRQASGTSRRSSKSMPTATKPTP